MDLRAQLLDLVAPVGVGAELEPGVWLRDASTELGLRLVLEVHGCRVDVEIAPRDDAAPHAATTGRWMLSYRSGEGSRRVAPELGLRAVLPVAERVRANELRVLAAVEAAERPARIREVRSGRILEPGDGFDTLSPYVGCLIGCRFCYAQSRLVPLRRHLGHGEAPWGSWVDVRVDAPERLRQELKDRAPRPIKLCPIVSDPYHAIEARYRLTRRCLEAIAGATAPPPVLVLTRSVAILEDLDVLRRLPAVWAGMSLPTIDDDVRAHFEPRAAPIHRRLQVLAQLRAAGLHTIAVVQPMLPGPVDALADALAATVDSVSLDVLRGVESATTEFADPRMAFAADDAWQRAQLQALRTALAERSVPVWPGEVPPELETPR